MKFGFRVPSIKKRIAARTSVKRIIRHNLGFKAPRGWGWVTNPNRALYNKVYNKTSRGCLVNVLFLISMSIAFVFVISKIWSSVKTLGNKNLKKKSFLEKFSERFFLETNDKNANRFSPKIYIPENMYFRDDQRFEAHKYWQLFRTINFLFFRTC